MLNMMLLNATPTPVAPPGASDGKFDTLDNSFANQLHAQLKPAQQAGDTSNGMSKKNGNQHTPQEVLIAQANRNRSDLVEIQPEPRPDALINLAGQPKDIVIKPPEVGEHSHHAGDHVQLLQEIAESKQLSAAMQGNSLLGNSQPGNAVQGDYLQTNGVPGNLMHNAAATAGLAQNGQALTAANAGGAGQGVLQSTLQSGEIKAAITLPEQSKMNGAIPISENQLNALQQAAKESESVRASMPANAIQAFQHRAQLQQQAVNPQAPLAAVVPVKQAMADNQTNAMQQTNMAQPLGLESNNSSNNLASMPQGMQANGAISNPLISAPLASAGWQQQVGQQVVNMHLRQDNQIALRLHPAELGPLMVNLKMDEQAASLQFTSANPQVRAALEAAIPQLRELLAEQGIQLSDSNVSDGHAEQQSEQQGSDSSGLADNSEIAASQQELERQEQRLDIQLENGQIDLYA
ncbi:MAG: flagellar hook-length control protein FliK [Idiomarina sp.]|nr:flagellar hook-length control protein FliK [Idiomarina sp.]